MSDIFALQVHDPGWAVISAKASADIGWHSLGSAISFTTLAFVSVLMRWYSRAFLTRRVGLEDMFVTFALILSIAMTSIVGAELKLDAHEVVDEDKKTRRLSLILKLVFAQSLLFHTSINVVKSSILIQYIFLFSSHAKIRRFCYFILFLVLAICGWGVLGVVFLCQPIDKYWDLEVSGMCHDAEKHFWSSAIFGILLDFAIWVLPMPIIVSLTLKGRQKVGLFIVMGLGGFVCMTSILRLLLVHDAAKENDITKAGNLALIWSSLEINVAIICASLLVMKPLFLRVFPQTQTASSTLIPGGGHEVKTRSWPSGILIKTRSTGKGKTQTEGSGSCSSFGGQNKQIARPGQAYHPGK
ncbi:hypothetical protein EJ04DRAFT_603287 [Polyplosphaeria fusca]|uniref:Rhodopsin domain-containing protein n=1 Tax=Polyplosphaeria fusca TaxID=682080 RepID=A0A9P4QX69_9PLEO|nr:hypothetical protein EJ04DRAFT_603287 [Polyplosphaeria fusca]